MAWDFTGTAVTFSDGNRVDHTVTGSLTFASLDYATMPPIHTISMNALVDGVDSVVASIYYVTAIDGAPGTVDYFDSSNGMYSVSSLPYPTPPSATSDPFVVTINLRDKNGSLFDGTYPLPPAHAPDIDIFAAAGLSISQRYCIVGNPISGSLLCSTYPNFTVSFTSFSDPVPEPRSLAWLSLAGLGALALGGRRSRF